MFLQDFLMKLFGGSWRFETSWRFSLDPLVLPYTFLVSLIPFGIIGLL